MSEFETAPPTHADIPITDLLPTSVRERVTVGPPEDWVVVREVDYAYRSGSGDAATVLLNDLQCHASKQIVYERTVRRLEAMTAVQVLGQWRLNYFDPTTQHVVIHSLAVRRGDNTVENAVLKRVRFIQREANLESAVIDGAITLLIVLEDLRIGDVLDASYSVRTAPRFLADRFQRLASIPPNLMVRDFRLSVRFHSGDEMKWKGGVDFSEPVIRELEGETEWSWSLERYKPRELESKVPPLRQPRPWLEVTNFRSWGEAAEGLRGEWREEFDAPELVECARLIAEKSDSPAARAVGAISMVQDEIRYLSMDVGLGGQIPSPPGAVLTRRFGDSKDKSFLLAHLLRRLGIPARPVLVSTVNREMLQHLLPALALFDHVIVEYELNGQRRWVDGSTTFQGGSALERFIPDYEIGLPLGPGVTDLEKLGPSPSNDFYHLREVFRLDTTSRPTLLRVHITAGGREAEYLRRKIGMDGLEALSREREAFYRSMFQDARRLDQIEWRDDRERNVLVLADSYELPHATTPVGQTSTFLFQYQSRLVQQFLVCPDSPKRRYPLALPPRSDIEHWIEVEAENLPRGETKTFLKRDNIFRFACEVKMLFGKMTAHLRLRTFAEEVPPQNFDQFKEKVQDVLPYTGVSIRLPSGIAAPKGRRRAQSLAPSSSPESAANKKPNGAEETAPQALDPNPAPALASLASAVEKTAPWAPTAAAKPSPAPEEVMPDAPRTEADYLPAAEEPIVAERAPVDRFSRRRRRKQARLKKWAMALAFLSAIILTVILCVKAIYKTGPASTFVAPTPQEEKTQDSARSQ